MGYGSYVVVGKPSYEELAQKLKASDGQSVEGKWIEALPWGNEEQYQQLIDKSYEVVYSVTPDVIISFIGAQIV